MGRSIKLVAYYFAYQLLFSFLVIIPTAIGMATGGTEVENMAYELGKTTGETAGIAMVLSGIAMIVHLIYFKYVKFNKESWTEVPLKTILMSIPFIVAVIFASNILTEFMNLPNHMEDMFIKMSRTVFGFISIAIMAPLIEELLFRGAIEGHLLRQGKSPRTAIFLSALIFGVIHLNPVQIPFAFFLGLVFGWLYYRTGSVIPGIVGHFLNNTVASLMMAFMSEEEAKQTTMETIGAAPTYLLFGAAIAVSVGMFLYLKKHLPQPEKTIESATPEL